MATIKSQEEFNAAYARGDREFEIEGDCTLAVTSADELLLVVNSGQPRIVAMGSSQPRIVARGSSQPRIVAMGSSQPRIEARESSQPRIEAWGSSQPRIEAWESSQPRIEARESSQPRIVARESSQPRIVAMGSSQPRIVARESSQPRIEAWGRSSQPTADAKEYVQMSILGRVTVTAGPMVSVLIDGEGSKVVGGNQIVVGQTTVKRDPSACDDEPIAASRWWPKRDLTGLEPL